MEATIFGSSYYQEDTNVGKWHCEILPPSYELWNLAVYTCLWELILGSLKWSKWLQVKPAALRTPESIATLGPSPVHKRAQDIALCTSPRTSTALKCAMLGPNPPNIRQASTSGHLKLRRYKPALEHHLWNTICFAPSSGRGPIPKQTNTNSASHRALYSGSFIRGPSSAHL